MKCNLHFAFFLKVQINTLAKNSPLLNVIVIGSNTEPNPPQPKMNMSDYRHFCLRQLTNDLAGSYSEYAC